jgi:hypothetical protein
MNTPTGSSVSLEGQAHLVAARGKFSSMLIGLVLWGVWSVVIVVISGGLARNEYVH